MGIFRRGRYDGVRPAVRLAIRRHLATEGVSRADRRAFAKALDDDDALDAALAAMEEDGTPLPVRDGTRFSNWIDAIIRLLPALAEFLKAIVPLLGGLFGASEAEDVSPQAADLGGYAAAWSPDAVAQELRNIADRISP